ncbi:MAG: GAF domain-containing protein [Deltaproteobacteria bacterium]|nr:GAF domain-containing protein [Deltaproteobacteria bacterium]
MVSKDARLEALEKRCGDLIDVARLVSLSFDKDVIIKKALEHVHERLGKRARYAVLKDGDLMIRHWVGEYKGNVVASQKVAKKSILWDVFTEGKALNLTDPSQINGYEHTLAEHVKVKAIVPLRYVDARTHQEVRFGVLVVDSGTEQAPITEEEFDYLQIMADLIAEAVGKTGLVKELIHSYEKREEASKAFAHFLRNRFMVIGGFSRRLMKKADNKEVKEYAETIAREIEEMERSLQALEEMLQGEEEELQRARPEAAL